MQFRRRKWGFYITLLDRLKFKVKLLRFKRGGECSYQWHKSRNELWLCLSGMGRFVKNGKISLLTKGDWQVVQINDRHRYKAEKATWILELQYGDYCIESDIVRTK